MINCFDDVVSLREYCEPTTPFSGTYLNDIGLGKKQIEDIITGDYATVRSLVEATIRQSAQEMAMLIHSQVANTVTVKSGIESGTVGFPASEGPTLVTTTGDEVGVKVELENAANFMAIEIKEVTLWCDFSGAVDLLVYDLHTGILLDTIPVTAVAGTPVSVYFNKRYLSEKKPRSLFIGYDSTAINSYKTTTRQSQCCGNYGRHTSYTHFTGWNRTLSTATQTTNGLTVIYSLSCDPYSWMCAYSQMMSLPIAHLVAGEIYRRGLMVSPTVRSNNSTNTNADLMKANMEWHMMKHNEMTSSLMKLIHIPSSSVCYSCKSPVRHAIVLP